MDGAGEVDGGAVGEDEAADGDFEAGAFFVLGEADVVGERLCCWLRRFGFGGWRGGVVGESCGVELAAQRQQREKEPCGRSHGG